MRQSGCGVCLVIRLSCNVRIYCFLVISVLLNANFDKAQGLTVTVVSTKYFFNLIPQFNGNNRGV